MPADAGSDSTAASGDQLLPPVFTRWSTNDRPAEGAQAPADDPGIPDDAFIFPEGAERPATEADAATPDWSAGPIDGAHPGGPANAEHLAARLERLAERLRVEGPSALAQDMTRGDRLDAALAGLLSGYLAASAE